MGKGGMRRWEACLLAALAPALRALHEAAAIGTALGAVRGGGVLVAAAIVAAAAVALVVATVVVAVG